MSKERFNLEAEFLEALQQNPTLTSTVQLVTSGVAVPILRRALTRQKVRAELSYTLPSLTPFDFTRNVIIDMRIINAHSDDDTFFSSGGFELPLPRGRATDAVWQDIGVDSTRVILSISRPMRLAFADMPEVALSMNADIKLRLPTPSRKPRLGSPREVDFQDFCVPSKFIRDEAMKSKVASSVWAQFLACAVDEWLSTKSPELLAAWVDDYVTDTPAPPLLPSVRRATSKGKGEGEVWTVSAVYEGTRCSFSEGQVAHALTTAIAVIEKVTREKGRDFAESAPGRKKYR